MAWAGNEAEDLGTRVEEVEELGDEQEAERLGEVAEDADDGEDHAGEVAVGVANKDLCRIPVVREQSYRDAYPGKQEIQREEVRICRGMRIRGEEVETIVERDEQ